MITRLLIANRGEIACRIIRSCRELGIHSIAVYSAADEQAQHVLQADEAWYLGEAPAKDSYLNIEALLTVARRAAADAIHPGYGFLSENADFAEACRDQGVRFVGPAPEVIEDMGNKSAARQRMAAHGIPVVPGYDGDDQTNESLDNEARRIGYPLLIKPALGGGGKGMRVVETDDDLTTALEAARREAQAAFGDDHLLLERYLGQPRHIEVQILGDSHGNVQAIGERDCSVQRRHQKVVEEAPAPGLSDVQRSALLKAAQKAGEAVGYVGAGTVEFLVDGDGFYFMEMNTRLQVEHPVTELVTGVDLVAWQLRIANGDTLPAAFPPPRGHAIEVRLYAEDPARDFLPSSGRLSQFEVPEQPGIRLDSGFIGGDMITPHYDPMLAKLISHGESRQQALIRLLGALAGSQISGVANNRDFLYQLLSHPDIQAGPVDTDWLNRNPMGLGADSAARCQAAGEVAVHWWLRQGHSASPWALDGWRLLGPARLDLSLLCQEERLDVTLHRADAEHFSLVVGEETFALQARLTGTGLMVCQAEGPWQKREIQVQDNQFVCCRGDQLFTFALAPATTFGSGEISATEQRQIKAPLHGSVSQVLCQPGEQVSAGQPLLIVEAMKMEHTLKAPADAEVKRLCCQAGDQVAEGDLLIELANGDEAPTPDQKEHKHAAVTRHAG